MSLNWDISKVKNWEKKQEADHGDLDCLIWATLSIGMGNLNEKTAQEFCYRLNRYSREVGPLAVTKTGKTIIWSVSRLKKWFGLHTNVSLLSNAGFDQHMRKLTNR